MTDGSWGREGMEAGFGFDTAFLRRLQRLTIAARRPVRGPFAGPRRSVQRGASVEFADFRDYAPGDDLRRVDWSAYARLDRLFLRLYHAERMTTLTLILDHSPSMGFGEPSKRLMAARLAAIFSYISLGNVDRVAVLGLGSRLDHHFQAKGGKVAIPEVWRHIRSTMGAPAGGTNFGELRRFGAFQRAPGLTIVVSDFLSDSDWRGGLRALRAADQEVSLVQVLAPEEIEPAIRGDWALADVETNEVVETSVAARLLRRYEEELAAHTAALRSHAAQTGMTFVQMRSDAPLTETVLHDLYRAGLLR